MSSAFVEISRCKEPYSYKYLPQHMIGSYAEAAIAKVTACDGRIVGISYLRGTMFGSGEAIYFVRREFESRLNIVYTDDPSLAEEHRCDDFDGHAATIAGIMEDDESAAARQQLATSPGGANTSSSSSDSPES